MDVDGLNVTIVGTMAWAVASLVLFLLKDRLIARDDLWWLWVAITGTLLGLLELGYLLFRRRSRR